MSVDKNIKVITIYNFLNKSPLVDFVNKNFTEDRSRMINNIENLIDKLSLIGIGSHERHTESLLKDKVLCLLDSKAQWIYIIIIDNSYSERLGYEILNKLVNQYSKQLLTQLVDLKTSGGKRLKDDIQLTMVELENKYKDPVKVDTILAIDSDLKDLQHQMKGNVFSMMNNNEECGNLQKQSELIKDGAIVFSNDANVLKRENKWANRKLQIAGATILTGGILFLIFKFIL